MIHPIIPGVFRADHRVAEGNNGIIFGRQRAVVIDTGNDLAEGQELVDFVRGQGYAADWLILTHGHGDHILGSAAFAHATIFAHERTPSVMEAEVQRLAQRQQKDGAAVAQQITWPTVTFPTELHLDLGDRELLLFPAPGHSPDGICVYLPQERLLFAADTVATGIAPAISAGDSRVLEQSLQHLLAMEINILVAGHGPVLTGAEKIQDWLHWLLAYLHDVRAFVQTRLRAGDLVAAIAPAADYDAFIGQRLPRERHGMVRRHQLAVRKIVDEEVARMEQGDRGTV